MSFEYSSEGLCIGCGRPCSERVCKFCLAESEFHEKYNESFTKVREEIDAAERAYEEAINFGDLQMVKDIYFMLKSGEKFIDKVSKIKV